VLIWKRKKGVFVEKSESVGVCRRARLRQGNARGSGGCGKGEKGSVKRDSKKAWSRTSVSNSQEGKKNGRRGPTRIREKKTKRGRKGKNIYR